MDESKTKIKKILVVYDLEVFPNFFSLSALNIETEEEIVMYITEDQNNGGTPLSDIIYWLQTYVRGMVGYNNLNYDYPVLHFLLSNYNQLIELTPKEICTQIFKKSKEIIEEEYSAVASYKVKIPQLDLYAIHHFDNPAKRTSLKDLEIAMRWEQVMDYPRGFDEDVLVSEIKEIVNYNMNDVRATYEFYKNSQGEINLRKQLSKEYGINLINANDPKIGSEIFAKLLSESMGVPIKELRQMRTERESIVLKDLILPTIKFTTNKFKNLLGNIRCQVVKETKGSLKNTVINNGFKYEFGLGGLHGCEIAGVYTPKEDEMICSCDVASLYPSIAINNGFYPAHLGEAFVDVYRSIRDQRLVAKKAGDKVKDGGLKLAINGVYGKSNDKYSFLYDPQFTMSITINGQLLLAMLCERLQEAGFTLLMVNTDGIECRVSTSSHRTYLEICSNWEIETGLVLEQAGYDKLVIRDVNNYIGISGKKVKLKGAFEIDKGWHKDTSSKIVSLAIYEKFVNSVDPYEYISAHTNIYDFCNRFKATYGWHSETRCLDVDKVAVRPQQKTNRYYMSTSGSKYYKVHQDGREQLIEATGQVKIFNNYFQKPSIYDYHIDYNYYVKEVNKILNVVDNKQLKLF